MKHAGPAPAPAPTPDENKGGRGGTGAPPSASARSKKPTICIETGKKGRISAAAQLEAHDAAHLELFAAFHNIIAAFEVPCAVLERR